MSTSLYDSYNDQLADLSEIEFKSEIKRCIRHGASSITEAITWMFDASGCLFFSEFLYERGILSTEYGNELEYNNEKL